MEKAFLLKNISLLFLNRNNMTDCFRQEGYLMSRSYRKYPIFQPDKGGAKWEKNQANRRLRRRADCDALSGKSALYRRFYSSWMIHDVLYRWTKKEAEESWDREESLLESGVPESYRFYNHRRFRTKRRFLNHWAKQALRK
jgi:hypothetical protein